MPRCHHPSVPTDGPVMALVLSEVHPLQEPLPGALHPPSPPLQAWRTAGTASMGQ